MQNSINCAQPKEIEGLLSRPSSSPFGKHKLEKEIERGEIYPLSRSRTINLILALLTLDEDMS